MWSTLPSYFYIVINKCQLNICSHSQPGIYYKLIRLSIQVLRTNSDFYEKQFQNCLCVIDIEFIYLVRNIRAEIEWHG